MTTRKTSPRRLLVAGAAAAALIVAVASPAAAENLPVDTEIDGVLEDGFIQLGDTTFPLGDDPTDPCGTNDDSTITASIGEEVNDVAPITDVVTDFDEGEAASGVCAQLVVVNSPNGTQTQTGDGEGTAALDDPGPDIEVQLDNGCTIDVGIVDLNGSVTGSGPTWDLVLGASGFTVPAVASGGGCSFSEAFAINFALGLPEDDTEVRLEFVVSEV